MVIRWIEDGEIADAYNLNRPFVDHDRDPTGGHENLKTRLLNHDHDVESIVNRFILEHTSSRSVHEALLKYVYSNIILPHVRSKSAHYAYVDTILNNLRKELGVPHSHQLLDKYYRKYVGLDFGELEAPPYGRLLYDGGILKVFLDGDWFISGFSADKATVLEHYVVLVGDPNVDQSDPTVEGTLAWAEEKYPDKTIVLYSGEFHFKSPFVSRGNLIFTDKCKIYVERLYNLEIRGNIVKAVDGKVFVQGVPIWNSDSPFLVSWICNKDGGEDCSIKLSILTRTAKKLPYLVFTDGQYKIDGLTAIHSSGTIVYFTDGAVLSYGAKGTVRVIGNLAVEPDAAILQEDVPAGATRIKIGLNDIGRFSVGDIIIIRGFTDISLYSYEHEVKRVIDIDTVNGYLYLDTPLENPYLSVYSNPEYEVMFGRPDRTYIYKVIFSYVDKNKFMSYPYDVNLTRIPVLDSGKFSPGDLVRITSDLTQETLTGITPNKNRVVFTTAKVVDVDYVNNELILEKPVDWWDVALPIIYYPDANVWVEKIEPVKNTYVFNMKVSWYTDSEHFRYHGLMFMYAENCGCFNLTVDGSNGMAGSGLRFETGYKNFADGVTIKNPKFGYGGAGYGITFYASSYCICRNFYVEGCRHGVLFFKSADFNLATDGEIRNFAISAIDFHGSCERNNVVRNVIIYSGDLACDSSGFTTVQTGNYYTRSFVKFGNPRHTAGGASNRVINIVCYGSEFKDEIICHVIAGEYNRCNSIINVEVYGCRKGVVYEISDYNPNYLFGEDIPVRISGLEVYDIQDDLLNMDSQHTAMNIAGLELDATVYSSPGGRVIVNGYTGIYGIKTLRLKYVNPKLDPLQKNLVYMYDSSAVENFNLTIEISENNCRVGDSIAVLVDTMNFYSANVEVKMKNGVILDVSSDYFAFVKFQNSTFFTLSGRVVFNGLVRNPSTGKVYTPRGIYVSGGNIEDYSSFDIVYGSNEIPVQTTDPRLSYDGRTEDYLITDNLEAVKITGVTDWSIWKLKIYAGVYSSVDSARGKAAFSRSVVDISGDTIYYGRKSDVSVPTEIGFYGYCYELTVPLIKVNAVANTVLPLNPIKVEWKVVPDIPGDFVLSPIGVYVDGGSILRANLLDSASADVYLKYSFTTDESSGLGLSDVIFNYVSAKVFSSSKPGTVNTFVEPNLDKSLVSGGITV